MSSAASKIVMVACINPGSSSADHTINTLRYAERLKTDKGKDVYKNPEALGYLQVSFLSKLFSRSKRKTLFQSLTVFFNLSLFAKLKLKTFILRKHEL